MNHLQYESSPYLLQHRNNPIDWYSWSDVALDKAKAENKMLIISIGYAACHWCHVMEHESFEDFEVAEIMNIHFISIKVDREERPDIDNIYMNAAMITTGQGGWPLNIIAMPDGRPVFAGTYFPKQQWIQVLDYFIKLYNEDRQKLEIQAKKISEGLHQIENIPLQKTQKINVEILDTIWENWLEKIDREDGGSKGAPKFLMPNNYEYLMRYYYQTKNNDLADFIKTTLKKVAFGGIHDIIGGGFARYSVDALWKVPHFEKMLYDNGQIISLYAQAYQLTKRPMYKSVCEQIFYWIEREMTDKSGGIYSALDADSEGIEGKYYCWTYGELETLLKDDFRFFCDVYNIEENGNFENNLNILFRTREHEYFIEKYKLSNEQFHQKLSVLHWILLHARNNKMKPATDDKILTEWNALFIKGLCDAYKAFGDDMYLKKATEITNFILSNCKKENYRLDRNYKNGKSSINAFLQDYAFFIDALISLHQVTLIEKYLDEAKNFLEYTIKHFYNSSNGLFYLTSDMDKQLIVRSTETSDNVIPSGNSTMAKNLFLLSKYFDNSEYEKMSATMLNNVLAEIIKDGRYFSNWAIVLDLHLHSNTEVVIVGKDAREKMKQLQKIYLPNVLFSGSEHKSEFALCKERYKEGKTLIYVCTNKSCHQGIENTEDALTLLFPRN